MVGYLAMSSAVRPRNRLRKMDVVSVWLQMPTMSTPAQPLRIVLNRLVIVDGFRYEYDRDESTSTWLPKTASSSKKPRRRSPPAPAPWMAVGTRWPSTSMYLRSSVSASVDDMGTSTRLLNEYQPPLLILLVVGPMQIAYFIAFPCLRATESNTVSVPDSEADLSPSPSVPSPPYPGSDIGLSPVTLTTPPRNTSGKLLYATPFQTCTSIESWAP
mmetsp:Transcript_7405/g.26454  ORF Transcript_7405/g.26454 Transcript_7405/m.26454 type:complete len:215 (+) Transcript_7405:437-1081(+)